MENLKSLFADMRKKENFTCRESGASDKEIKDLEKALGFELPDAYASFLKEFSYAWWFGHAVYGISEDKDFDSLSYTLEARSEKTPKGFQPLPPDCVIIERYGGGGYYVLYGKGSPLEGQVARLLDEEWWKPEIVSKTFQDFLKDLLKPS
jgi:hypothetical protein